MNANYSKNTNDKGDFSFPDKLTKREREVLELLRHGKRNKEIASELHLSLLTVQNHVHRILRKLGVKSRTEAAVYTTQHTTHPSYQES